jgi:hypothetical protein
VIFNSQASSEFKLNFLNIFCLLGSLVENFQETAPNRNPIQTKHDETKYNEKIGRTAARADPERPGPWEIYSGQPTQSGFHDHQGAG